MKYCICILLSLSFGPIVFGQSQSHLIFDTTSSLNYSKTDFSVIDTLDLWNYQLDTTYTGKESDFVRPLGQLIFWRTKPIDDKISKKLYNQFWTPFIAFDIFKLSDSAFAYHKSNITRNFSSCVPPDMGGDLIIIDKFIFLNQSVCLSCQRHDTQIDYCRPVINFIFSKLDKLNFTTIESLVSKFIIKGRQLPIGEKRETY